MIFTVTRTTTVQVLADRDGYLGMGGNDAAAQSMDRMTELLRTLT